MSRKQIKIRRFLRFSLRTLFIVLTLLCVAIFLGHRAWRRNELGKRIIAEATLVFDGTERHAITQTVSRMGMRGGSYTSGPSPKVGLRDSRVPWISKWSGGSAIFCPFDSISYHVSNVPIPDWANEVLATGELRRASLRLNNPNIDWNLLMRCRGLEELSLWGQPHDPHALRGIHRLRKLVKLNLITIGQLEYDQLLSKGLPPNLVDLRLVDCNIQSSDLVILKGCQKLESLDLSLNPINLQALSDVGLPPNLKSVVLQRTRCVKEDLLLLAQCKQLTSLKLSMRNVDLRSLDGVELPVSLEHLALWGATLDASNFRWFSQLPNLKTLRLNGCRFEDADAEGIVLSPSITSFHASSTNAGHHVCAMLANASGMTSLNLYDTRIDDESLLAVGSKQKLNYLQLGRTGITDASANWFRDLKNLDYLDLRETGISNRLFELAPHLKEAVGQFGVNDTKVSQSLQDEIQKAARGQLSGRARKIYP